MTMKQMSAPQSLLTTHPLSNLQLCLAHYCDIHGPTPLMVTEGVPVRCAKCDDDGAAALNLPTSPRQPPFMVAAAGSDAADRPRSSSSQYTVGGASAAQALALGDALRRINLGVARSSSVPPVQQQPQPQPQQQQQQSPPLETASPSSSTAAASPSSPSQPQQQPRRDFHRTYDEFVTRRAVPCDSCAMTMPQRLASRQQQQAPYPSKAPVLRTRKAHQVVFSGSTTASNIGAVPHILRRGESPASSGTASPSSSEGESGEDDEEEGSDYSGVNGHRRSHSHRHAQHNNHNHNHQLLRPRRPTTSSTSRSSISSSTGGLRSASGGASDRMAAAAAAGLSSHTHEIDYTSTHEPSGPSSFKIVRNSCLRTLSLETLPRGHPNLPQHPPYFQHHTSAGLQQQAQQVVTQQQQAGFSTLPTFASMQRDQLHQQQQNQNHYHQLQQQAHQQLPGGSPSSIASTASSTSSSIHPSLPTPTIPLSPTIFSVSSSSSSATAAAAAATTPTSANFVTTTSPGSAASGGPIFFGDPVAGYTTAYIFRIPDVHARGHKRVYAFLALSTTNRSERLAMRGFGHVAAKFRELAAWIQRCAELEAERNAALAAVANAGGVHSTDNNNNNNSPPKQQQQQQHPHAPFLDREASDAAGARDSVLTGGSLGGGVATGGFARRMMTAGGVDGDGSGAGGGGGGMMTMGNGGKGGARDGSTTGGAKARGLPELVGLPDFFIRLHQKFVELLMELGVLLGPAP